MISFKELSGAMFLPSVRPRAALLDLLAATCIASSLCNAQQPDRAAMRMVLGCWSVTASPFTGKGPTGAGVDPGQTTLPSIVKFDSLPGPLSNSTARGHRIQGVTGYTMPMYRSGDYRFQQHDSLVILWYNASNDTRLTLGADSLVMRGRAEAGTDYLGEEHATVVLRRTTCPERPDTVGLPVDIQAPQITGSISDGKDDELAGYYSPASDRIVLADTANLGGSVIRTRCCTRCLVHQSAAIRAINSSAAALEP